MLSFYPPVFYYRKWEGRKQVPSSGHQGIEKWVTDSNSHHKKWGNTVGNQRNNPPSGIARLPRFIEFNPTISFQNMFNAFHTIILGAQTNSLVFCLLQQLP